MNRLLKEAMKFSTGLVIDEEKSIKLRDSLNFLLEKASLETAVGTINEDNIIDLVDKWTKLLYILTCTINNGHSLTNTAKTRITCNKGQSGIYVLSFIFSVEESKKVLNSYKSTDWFNLLYEY